MCFVFNFVAGQASFDIVFVRERTLPNYVVAPPEFIVLWSQDC